MLDDCLPAALNIAVDNASVVSKIIVHLLGNLRDYNRPDVEKSYF